MAEDAKLYSPYTLRGVTLRNRIALSPMCTYSAEFDGKATDWHLGHYAAFASGGVGLLMTEAVSIFEEGRISPKDLGLWEESQIEPLARITRLVKKSGATPAIQLGHAGRKAAVAAPQDGGKPLGEFDGWPITAPSSIPFDEGFQLPATLLAFQIPRLLMGYRDAAKRAIEAGFEVIELHAAHGYMIHQFLSPLSNTRTDEYGGGFANRTRFLREAVAAVRSAIPEETPLIVRLSATDWAEGGWNVEESVELSRELKTLGVDLIDCSTGGNLPRVKIPIAPGYQVRFAERIKKEAAIATGAVGLITEAAQAQAILDAGQADLIFMARKLLRDPFWPLRAAAKIGQSIDWPNPYVRGKV